MKRLALFCLAAIALCGCVTVSDCDTRIKSRLLLAECQWDFGPVR